jgi:hypothetical protein
MFFKFTGIAIFRLNNKIKSAFIRQNQCYERALFNS